MLVTARHVSQMAAVLVRMCNRTYFYKLEMYYCCKEQPGMDGSMVLLSIKHVAYSLWKDEYLLHLEDWCNTKTWRSVHAATSVKQQCSTSHNSALGASGLESGSVHADVVVIKLAACLDVLCTALLRSYNIAPYACWGPSHDQAYLIFHSWTLMAAMDHTPCVTR